MCELGPHRRQRDHNLPGLPLRAVSQRRHQPRLLGLDALLCPPDPPLVLCRRVLPLDLEGIPPADQLDDLNVIDVTPTPVTDLNEKIKAAQGE